MHCSLWGRHLRLSVVAFCGLLLIPACAGKKETVAGSESQPVTEGSAQAESDKLDDLVERQALQREFADVVYRKRMDQALAYQRANRMQDALNACDDALRHRPDSVEALALQAGLQRALGVRSGIRDQITVLSEEARARHDQQLVSIRKALERAHTHANAKNFDVARKSYEDALFIVNTAPQPTAVLSDLGQQATDGLADLAFLEESEAERREVADARLAIERIAREEEAALIEARDRRAMLLAAAIDRFNLEAWEQAAEYASQVLAEEPDNTVAQQILTNARQARQSDVNKALINDLKENFRKWKVEIERTKVPQGEILQWPSQKFWDKITAMRKAGRRLGAGGHELTEEEKRLDSVLDDRRLDMPFVDPTPFPQVIQFLNAATGVNFFVDPRAKEDLDSVEITLQVKSTTLRTALELLLKQASPEGEIVHQLSGNVVRIIKKEHLPRNFVLHVHPVADLTTPLTDFLPPDIMLIGVDEEAETPLFGGVAEEGTPQPFGTIDELIELVRSSVQPEAWEDPATMSAQRASLVVYNTPGMQNEVADFLDDLRGFLGIVVTIETRFLTITDAFLRDVGVDLRGLGGTNGGALAVLDDVTSGLISNASAALDNSGPGLGSGGAATSPSSGLFFNDGGDGDFRGRSENISTVPLGTILSALGGGTFQMTYIGGMQISAILRATEKKLDSRRMVAPTVTVYNTQRANISVVNQISFLQDFDVEVAQTSFIADPVIGVIQDGLVLDVRPVVSNDRQFVTLTVNAGVTNLQIPIETFETDLGQSVGVPRFRGSFAARPRRVTIQLPEIDLTSTKSTARVPNGGSLLLGGLKTINITDSKIGTPIISQIPVLSFLFSRQGKSEETSHLMIIMTATITDLQQQTGEIYGKTSSGIVELG
ncbi:MAG: hypothetical protein V3T86_04650 [Planctomycetota bacterium]